MEDLRWVTSVVIVGSTLFAVAFPILFAFSTWNRSALGRILMADSLAYAGLMVITAIFRFWRPSSTTVVVSYMIAFILISATNAALLYMLWRLNYHKEGTQE